MVSDVIHQGRATRRAARSASDIASTWIARLIARRRDRRNRVSKRRSIGGDETCALRSLKLRLIERGLGNGLQAFSLDPLAFVVPPVQRGDNLRLVEVPVRSLNKFGFVGALARCLLGSVSRCTKLCGLRLCFGSCFLRGIGGIQDSSEPIDRLGIELGDVIVTETGLLQNFLNGWNWHFRVLPDRITPAVAGWLESAVVEQRLPPASLEFRPQPSARQMQGADQPKPCPSRPCTTGRGSSVTDLRVPEMAVALDQTAELAVSVRQVECRRLAGRHPDSGRAWAWMA